MRKLIVFLLTALAILTACSQQSNSSSSSQGGAGKGDIVTKSYKTEKQLEHGKETRILTVSYSGQKYDKVILHVSKAIPDNIKEALSKQDVSTVKKEMLSLIEEALGLKEAVNITGLDLKTDMTAEEISLEMTIDPENLDYEAAKKLPNYAQLFEQIETLSPEELLNKFKGSDGVEVPSSNLEVSIQFSEESWIFAGFQS